MKGSFYSQIKDIASQYKDNKIFIIGKGPSLESYLSYDFSKSIVISINDSFNVIKSDLIFINKPWSLNNISKLKNKYISFSDNSLANTALNSKSHQILEKQPEIYAEGTLNIDSFYDEGVSIENPLFISAMKAVMKIAKNRERKLKVYMLGFDFNYEDESSYTIPSLEDKKEEEGLYRRAILGNQENILINLINSFASSEHLEINHVGDKAYSTISTQEFLNSEKGNLKRKIPSKAQYQVKIVAEITTNHLGNKDLLVEMIRRAKESGADFVKVQKRNVETFYSKSELESYYFSDYGNTFRDYRNGLELSKEDFIYLDEECKKIGIEWFASILDKESLDFILEFKPKLIKIPSTISEFSEYHDYVAERYTGDIVISTGLTSVEYEDYILNKFKNNSKIYLLQCTSSYPTKDEDCSVSVVRHYRDLSKSNNRIIPGYSSHDLGSRASCLALAAGAMMIEKHVKMRSVFWSHFDSVSLSLENEEFANFVEDIRSAEVICGSEDKQIKDSEHHKYKKV